MRRLWLGVIMAFLLLTVVVVAQDITPLTPPQNSDVNITFPPPVYVLSRVVEIKGSANADDQSNYFLEFRPLVWGDDAPPDEERPWFPATLPAITPVTAGVLGVWNTTTIPDGLYELRLTVNISNSEPEIFRVAPLRVDNASVLVQLPEATLSGGGVPAGRPTLQPTPTGLPGAAPALPSLIPSPTGLSVSSARVEAVINANVRTGDATVYPRMGSLRGGETAPVLGISSTGSGWYYIELSNGERGFIAPSTVRALGDFSRLQQVTPPPRPTPVPRTDTPTPLPATNTPAVSPTPGPVTTSGNLAITNVILDPAQPRCNEAFSVTATIVNNGGGPIPNGFTVRAVDVHNGTGKATAATTGGVPPLGAGAAFSSVMYLTVNTFYEEGHTLSVIVDPGNQIGETNEGDNVFSVGYVLAVSGC